MMKTIVILVLSSMISWVSAYGKDEKKATKRTKIDFEDELIQGEAQKPELFYLLQKRQFNYKKMIRLRENFLPEMRQTSESIGIDGGKR
jgi:hypothetical protein